MKHNINIFMEDCVLVGEKVYFFSKDWNGLYFIDLKEKKTKIVGSMPEEKIEAKRLCAGIVQYNKKLILIPMTAKKIWIYDLQNNQWVGIKRKFVTDDNSCKEIFRATIYKKNLYLIGSNYPAIIRMDMNTYKLDYLTEPYTFLSPIKSRNQCYFRADFFVKKNKLYVASCLNHYVLSVNLDTFNYEWHEVGEKGFCYSGIAWDGKNYWLSPRKGTPIVKWDGKKETEYFPLPDEFDKELNNFLGVQYYNGKLIFPGMLQKKTVVLDPEQLNKVSIYEGQYLFYRCFGKYGIVSQRYDGLFQLRYSLQDKSYDLYCKIPFREFAEYIKSNFNINKKEAIDVKIEYSHLSLPIFISILDKKRLAVEKNKKIGEKVWENIQS